MVFILAGSILFATAAVFGISLAAAYVAKDTKISGNSYLQTTTGRIVQTGNAHEHFFTPFYELSFPDLTAVEKIFLSDSIKLNVKGVAKDPSGRSSMFIVEGGTITFDEDGGVEVGTVNLDEVMEYAGLKTQGRKLYRKVSNQFST